MTSPSPAPPPTGTLIAALVVVAIAVFIAWRISLRTHPRTRCPRCHGQPRTYHPLFRRHFAPCSRCNGAGHVLRKGAKDH